MRNLIELLAFHDERKIKRWLYHGFVLCEAGQFPLLTNELLKAKTESNCKLDKRIHFSKLTSKSTGSSKTRTALRWVELFRKDLYKSMWFYFFGINLTNIDYEFFGSRDKDFKIYNRFFEIGLFSACRYFFDATTENVEILQIFSEKRDLPKDDPFLIHAPYKINKRETNVVVKSKRIFQVASTVSKEKIRPEYVHIINLADVLTGAFSQVIDYTANKQGCTEVADKIFPICRRLTENPYNKNSLYYKRYAISFFPKKRISRSIVMRYGIKPAEDQFYCNRKLRLHQPECIPGFEQLID